MKKTLIGAAMALFSWAAVAAGPYDGIYQSARSNTTYISVHQNGGNMIAAIFGSLKNGGNTSFSNSAGSITPVNLETWEAVKGGIVGNVATLAGTVNYEGCEEIYRVVFDGNGGAVVTILSSVSTPRGFAYRLNCGAGAAIGSTLQFVKIF